jgi:type III pantothenate kinase
MMSTTVCIDLGNTRAKLGVFQNGQFMQEIIPATAELTDIKAALQPFLHEPASAFRSILCSVTHHAPDLEAFLAEKGPFLALNAHTPLPISIAYDTPETLGPDRIALVTGAAASFPGKHCLVIGAGTCVTYNFINKEKTFLGGAISPGLRMRFEAMHQLTDKLPLGAPAPVFPLIGYNTRQSLLSGVMNGILAEMLGFIGLYEDRYSNFNVILTGGDTAYLAPHLKNRIFADPFLIYRGLYEISAFNNNQK